MATPTPAAKTTKVKITKPHHAYAYHAGETGELPADKAAKLIKDGYAQTVAATDEQR